MAENLKFGIDLGTTNSVIAGYTKGKVEIYKNPLGHKETLPSVVAFRKEKIIVGDKAREYVEKDPENVFSTFKRKMGTSEIFRIKSLAKEISPIELSSIVLKELKNFVHTGEKVDAAVITIPASFDTIQSNATKKAGYEAGIGEVYLLQEPIAASLAFANSEADSDKMKEGKWLVYDLGGGTFDVAIVSIQDGEMKVLDHEGNNFLGGLDFDSRVIDKIIIPHLKQFGKFSNLESDLKSSTGKYNRLYYKLLLLSEDAKVVLSNEESTEIEFEIEDEIGEELEVCLTITRDQFEACIIDLVEDTITLTKKILERNYLSPIDLKFVLMVGGSTYIPLVRRLIKEKTEIELNCDMDPTSVVSLGAAYYSGTKVRKENKAQDILVDNKNDYSLKISISYQKNSQDTEEFFAAKVEGDYENLFYRITRFDGGYDSGLKSLKPMITENLSLVNYFSNQFYFKVYDNLNNPVNVSVPTIEINQGKYSLLGQPLPNDICIEIDDPENNVTKLEVIFEKNTILPVRKTIIKTINKHISKGSKDGLFINILEGSRFSVPESNLPIGTIEITGETVTRDLVKGADIEIMVEMSESRDLRITTFLMMTDQEFSNLFSPTVRSVNLAKLKDDIANLLRKGRSELSISEKRENFELAASLNKVVLDLEKMYSDVSDIKSDDVTDLKYQLEDRKRKYAATIDELTKDKKISEAVFEYHRIKTICKVTIEQRGTEENKKEFEMIVSDERQMLASQSNIIINSSIDKLRQLHHKINIQNPEYIIMLYYAYRNRDSNDYIDPRKANELKEQGEKVLQRKNYEELKVITYMLYDLLPEEKQEGLKGTGIS